MVNEIWRFEQLKQKFSNNYHWCHHTHWVEEPCYVQDDCQCSCYALFNGQSISQISPRAFIDIIGAVIKIQFQILKWIPRIRFL